MSSSTNIPITHMFTDDSNHTRFKQKYLPLEPKGGLGSIGSFSSLFVNPILRDIQVILKCNLLLHLYLKKVTARDLN